MDRLGQKERDAAKHVAVGAKPGATADGPLDCPHVGMLLPDFAVPKADPVGTPTTKLRNRSILVA